MSQQLSCAVGDLAPIAHTHLTEKEFAELIGVTQSAIAKWRRSGRVPESIKIGATRYFGRAEVAEFLRRGN